MILTLIPIIISIVSLIISIITAFRSWWIERFKLDFEMVKWFGCNDSNYPFHIWLCITNFSKLPCSILEVKIENERNGQTIYGSGTGEKKYISSSKSNYKTPTETYSLGYPVNIDGYSSIGGYFHIYSDYAFHNFEESIVKITIRTNRGSISKSIFMDFGKNIFRVIQYKNNEIHTIKHSDGTPINFITDTDI